MSFFDDMLSLIPSAAGGVGGFLLGGPAGAMIGSGLGGTVANAFRGQPDNPYDKLTYVGPQPGQGFMPQDLATMEQARRSASQEAAGVQGALEQRMASAGGSAARGPAGYAIGQQASQAGIDRNSMFDLGRAGIASERDAENRKLLNDFNLKHTMLSADYNERANYANTVNRQNLFDKIGSLGMYFMNKGGGGADPFSGFGGMDVGEMPTWMTSGAGYGAT